MDESQDKNEEPAVQFAANPGPVPQPPADLEKMFREHHQRVFRAAYRVTGNAQDAEDATQTVFLRLARREGGFPLSDSPAGYLSRAAINAALDVVRSRKTHRATALADVEAVLAGKPDVDPGQRQAERELRDIVRAGLAKVSPKSAEIFILRYFEGYGNHEIASMLGTSRGTINVILHRTRNRLKEEIRSHLGDRP